ncbi:MAG: chemotaxis protein CheA [Canidatus Methanoxibalbensis ujae]|nr:chemotaxis protein CheA [Candidatus Methanoxibalbensis ujae]
MSPGHIDYLEAFLEETREHIETLTQSLLELDNAVERGGDIDIALNSAFRSAHTIKGMAASMGFHRMERICHALEEILDAVREREIDLTTDVTDVLLECSSFIETLISEIERDGSDESADISSALNELNAIKESLRKGEAGGVGEREREKVSADAFTDTSSGAFTNASTETSTDTSSGASAGAESAVSDEEDIKDESVKEREKKEDKKKDEKGEEEKGEVEGKIYNITVFLSEDCAYKGVRGYLVLKNLSEIGKIIETEPSIDDIENERFDNSFTVTLSTSLGEHEIRRSVHAVSDVEDVRINSDVRGRSSDAAEKKRAAVVGAGAGVGGDIARSVRISTEKLDIIMNLVGELVIGRSRLMEIWKNRNMDELPSALAYIERTISDLQYEVTQIRMIPVAHIFNRFPKLVRDICRSQRKKADLIVEGSDIEIDRTILEGIVDPLVHLLRNAVDHGIETPEERLSAGKPERGRIRLAAHREHGFVFITVEDDGRGIDVEKLKRKAVEKGLIPENAKMRDEDALKLIFMPGFSTSDRVTEISGRGVGMDVVKTRVESLGGSVEVYSEKGKGTSVVLKLPLTSAIIQALLIRVASHTYAIPLSNIGEIVSIDAADIKKMGDEHVYVFKLRGSILPVIFLHDVIRTTHHTSYASSASSSQAAQTSSCADVSGESVRQRHHGERLVVVVIERGGSERVGIIVDEVIEQQEIVVKAQGELLRDVRGLSGFTILGNGEVVPILDVCSLF